MTAKIYYAEIGEYMSRREKLDRLNELGDIDGVEWQEIIPNQHGDWINQRGDEFSELKPIEEIFKIRSNGLESSRDAWAWNFSRDKLMKNIKVLLENFKIEFDDKFIVESSYRPFNREFVYYDPRIMHRISNMKKFFPNGNESNLSISIPGTSSSKPFMPFIANRMVDYHFQVNGRSFPRYYFDGNEMIDAIDSDDLFYYIYGFLHLPEYRERFANDLKKSLPRIKIITGSDFIKISQTGKQLADLHLNYETQSPPDVKIHGIESGDFRVRKIKLDKKDPTRIRFNDSIWIENVPIEVNDYKVNGRSPVEWIIERYQIKVDKDSGIVNDPNDWCIEHGNPRYILDLLLSAMTVSLETQRLISELPTIEF